MALVDIDDSLKARMQMYVEKNNIDFPTMKNFCDKAIKKELDRLDQKAKDAKELLEG